MSISFNNVPDISYRPFTYVEIDNSKAAQGMPTRRYKILVIGHKSASSTKPSGTPILVTSEKESIDFFGSDSLLHSMLAALFQNNDSTETYALVVDEPSDGTAAAWDLTLTASDQRGKGVLALYLGGTRVSVPVEATDSIDTILAAIVKAITDNHDLMVSASADTVNHKVKITFRYRGDIGNKLDIRLGYYDEDTTPPGLTLTVTPTPGSGAPGLKTIFDSLGDTKYNVVACPFTDSKSVGDLKDILDARASPKRQTQSIAFLAFSGKGSDDAPKHLSNTGSPYMSVMAMGTSPTPPWAWSSALAGLVAFHGSIDPARPFTDLVIKGVLPARDGFYTGERREFLLKNGISTHKISHSGDVLVERIVSGYTKDQSYFDINTLLALDYIVESIPAYINSKYPRYKLASDNARFGPGQKVLTPALAKLEILKLARQLETEGIIDDYEQFKRALIVERNAKNRNRLDIGMSPTLVSQLLILGVKIEFLR